MMRMALVVLLVGCAPSIVLMRNDDGDLVRCEARADMGTGGYIGAQRAISDCVAAYEAQGYYQPTPGTESPRRKKRYEPVEQPVVIHRDQPAEQCTPQQRDDMRKAGVSESAISRACDNR